MFKLNLSTQLWRINIMKLKTFHNAPIYSALQNFAVVVQTGTKSEITEALQALKTNPYFQKKRAKDCIVKFEALLYSNTAQWSIFTSGNSKLPFFSFSSLPGVSCPGAGSCLEFCYSFTAWRFIVPFFRQAQNAYLMRFASTVIVDALAVLTRENPQGFDFRLYVDGDFSSLADVSFWFCLLRSYPMIKAYGYSKSLDLLVNYCALGLPLPDNYQLNISSGSDASLDLIERAKQLPFTRGEFVAVNIGRKVKSTEHGTATVNKALRELSPGKIFPCPGKCGACTGKGHACGLPSLKGVTIAIAVH